MQVFLNNCQRVELLAEQVYLQLATRSEYAERVRSTFARLGADEAQHAGQIELLGQAPLSASEVYPKIAREKVGEALSAAEKLLAEVTQKSLSEEGALRRALQMEQEFLKVHAHRAMHFDNPRLADFFNGLEREDQLHIDCLKELLTWWHAERKPVLQGR